MARQFPTSCGPYQLLEPLGQGAMAQVYRGLAPDGREVAVKLLHPSLTGDEGFLVRFQREVGAAGRLDHPHIVKVLAHGSEGEVHYLVMELIDGASLQAVLRGRTHPLTPAEAVALIVPLAEALDYAHRQGVIHRDVKPSNILLRGGRLDDPVLTDFGVVRLVEATVATQSGALLGTPAYMTPEQGLQGSRLNGSASYWTIGASVAIISCSMKPHLTRSSASVMALTAPHNGGQTDGSD